MAPAFGSPAAQGEWRPWPWARGAGVMRLVRRGLAAPAASV